MSTLTLDPQTDRQLAALATLTGEAPAEIARRAIAAYAAELEATRTAAEAKASLARLRPSAVVGDVPGPAADAGRSQQLAAALEAAARLDPFAGQDGAQWQRQQRADRPLPGRAE